MKSKLFLAAFGLVLASAGGAMAGGRAVCATGLVLQHDAYGRAVCVVAAPTARPGVQPVRVQKEYRNGLFCGYPHRPSDTAFIGGSGYLTKDEARRRQGCL